MAGGRPTKYNEDIAARVCELVATHTYGLTKLCATYDELPEPSTINLWRVKHSEFSERYAVAKLKQADLLAEECLDIADESRGDIKLDKDGNEICNTEFIARSRLRVDTRKWLASKLLPKQYGERKTEETKSPEETLLKIKELVADLNKTNASDV